MGRCSEPADSLTYRTVPTYSGCMTDLTPLNEDFSSALAIVAHPDDLEYGAASAIARWTAQGKQIGYLLVTRGEAGIDAIPPKACAPIRMQEEVDGAALVGVNDVEFLDHRDGMISYGLELRRDIAKAIREAQPDLVITINHHDQFGPGRYNQADHIAVGRAVIDGTRDAANRWVFPELLSDGLQPWKAQRILVSGSPQADAFVDVTASFDAGVASLAAHRYYLAGLGEHAMSDPRIFLEQIASSAGERAGVPLAVGFEVIEL